MEILSKFPERLKELMIFHDGIKSEALGKEVGISGTCIRSFLRGNAQPSLTTAVKLADFFHCTLDFLAGIKENDREVLPRPLPPFYENLRKVMKEREVSRYKIAHSKDFRDSHFTNWSKGDQPKLSTVCILAKYLHVTLDYLVGRTDY